MGGILYPEALEPYIPNNLPEEATPDEYDGEDQEVVRKVSTELRKMSIALGRWLVDKYDLTPEEAELAIDTLADKVEIYEDDQTGELVLSFPVGEVV